MRCALMHRVPLVVAGSTVLDPYEGYEARVLDRDGDVVGACEEVAAADCHATADIASEALKSHAGCGRMRGRPGHPSRGATAAFSCRSADSTGSHRVDATPRSCGC